MADRSQWSLAASVVASVGAVSGCAIPLILLLAGVGSSWLGTIHRLQPLWPLFVAITAVALGYAGWRIFRAPKSGDSERACADAGVLRRRKALFWVAVVVNAGMFLGTYLLFYAVKSSS